MISGLRRPSNESGSEYKMMFKAMLLNSIRLFVKIYQEFKNRKIKHIKEFADRINKNLNSEEKKMSGLSLSLDMRFRLHVLRTLRPLMEENYYHNMRQLDHYSKQEDVNQEKYNDLLYTFKQQREHFMICMTPKKTILERLQDPVGRAAYFDRYLSILSCFFKDYNYEWEHAEYFCKNLLINLLPYMGSRNRKTLFSMMNRFISPKIKDSLDFFFDRKFIKNKTLSIFLIEDLIKAFVIFELHRRGLDHVAILPARTIEMSKTRAQRCKTFLKGSKELFRVDQLVEVPIFFTETCKVFSQMLLQIFAQMGTSSKKELLFFMEDVFCSNSKHYVLESSHLSEFLPAFSPDFLDSNLFFSFHGDYSQILARIKHREQTLSSRDLLFSPNFIHFASAFAQNGESFINPF